ncbi:hypothetical protein [Mycobacterium sp. EPa45]|uniref:hypothetical protein n=1 Tax=Mycobacterium sp. EPa45 TaxID=1545728 RepID=UPI0006424E66|nr:hypothetical protein [Mycobacterium sp. EPa45]AKK27068.1 hypothetical protein AB431_10705 [Mycobacterium sp. EPa45]
MDRSTADTRRRRAAHKFAAWLAAGTIAAGLGAAAVSGSAVAYADTGSSGAASHSTSDSSNSTATNHNSTGSTGRTVGRLAPKATGAAAGDSKSRASLSLVSDSPAAKSTASATPKLPTPEAVLSDIARQIQYTFFNRTPTADPTQNPQSGEDKQITGAINGAGNNGFDPTYKVTTAPKYGELTLDPTTGHYTYVARDALIAPGITDQFTVTVNNGAAARLPGLLGQVQLLLHSVAVALGAAKPDTIDETITVTVTGTGIYGDQQTNAKNWQDQDGDNTCVLLAVASVVGQLNGDLPSEQAMVTLGKATTSVVDAPAKMYLGTKKDTGFAGLDIRDGVALLEHFSLTGTLTTFDGKAQNGQSVAETKAAYGQGALTAMAVALADGKAIMVDVDATTIVDASNGQVSNTVVTETDHEIAVSGVDLANGLVYVNDGNLDKGSVAIPLSAFMSAWGADNFGLIIAQKAVTAAAIAA